MKVYTYDETDANGNLTKKAQNNGISTEYTYTTGNLLTRMIIVI